MVNQFRDFEELIYKEKSTKVGGESLLGSIGEELETYDGEEVLSTAVFIEGNPEETDLRRDTSNPENPYDPQFGDKTDKHTRNDLAWWEEGPLFFDIRVEIYLPGGRTEEVHATAYTEVPASDLDADGWEKLFADAVWSAVK